jgi:hypothetical protein
LLVLLLMTPFNYAILLINGRSMMKGRGQA